MEDWKTINGFDGYEVSTLGRIRRGNLMMKFYNNGLGYLAVRIRKDKKRYRFYIHRVVLETFIPKPANTRVEVNHIDHNKANNHLSNLEWVTHRENLRKAVQILGKQAFRPHRERQA